MLKILSWNIRQGGGRRLKEIKSYINNSGAHIVILSEFRNNLKGINIRNGFLLNGYKYQVVSHSKSDENSVIIASKIPFNSCLFPDSDAKYSGNVIMAEFPLFRLYGCYLPHKKKHHLFDFLINETKENIPTIITGDLNSGINGLDQKGNSFWYEDELKTLEENRMIDAFREVNGQLRDYSWYSHQGNGYRYDHFYIQENLISLLSDCSYDHEARENGISDHSPMFLTLAP